MNADTDKKVVQGSSTTDAQQTAKVAKSAAKNKVAARKLSGPVETLHRFLEQVPETRRVWIGYSGGLDSHVLLHAASACRALRPDIDWQAVHVDHGLQLSSSEWANHCHNVCRDLKIPLKVLGTEVAIDPSVGPEASARIARYSLFATVMRDGDYLLLAQHADDQAETFLLQALRGSGPDGLASIPSKRSFSSGWLCRPLLTCNQQELIGYAEQHQLRWIDDPSNKDTDFDRNFLRHEVLPLLRKRWPALNQTLARSASRSGAASRLLMALAKEDLALVRSSSNAMSESPVALSISALLSLGQERLFNVLRLWIKEAGYLMPRLQDLKQVESDLLRASPESAGLVNARDYEFRRYRDQLFLLAPIGEMLPYQYAWLEPFDDLVIAELGMTLTRRSSRAQGIDIQDGARVKVQSRVGGELIKLGSPSFHKAVKKLLQEAGVPPWQRERIPLVYINGKLAAVWGVAVSNDFKTALA